MLSSNWTRALRLSCSGLFEHSRRLLQAQEIDLRDIVTQMNQQIPDFSLSTQMSSTAHCSSKSLKQMQHFRLSLPHSAFKNASHRLSRGQALNMEQISHSQKHPI